MRFKNTVLPIADHDIKELVYTIRSTYTRASEEMG